VDALARYAQRFGLGRETGIELEHEKAGLVPTSDWKLKKYKEAWQEGETLSVAIGQGFNLATPLQICLMTSAMVNGGNLYKPLLIEAVKDPEGTTLQKFLPVAVASDLGNKEWLGLIKDALVAVVNDKHGTAKGAKLKEVTVGGKTGTSQVVRLSQLKDLSEKDIPYKYRDHAWFTAFAPAEKPEIAVTVMIEHGGGGGANAAPVAKIVLERYFELQGVLPSEDESQPVAHPVTEPEIMVPQGQKVKKKVL
jgi:penicillin-binding protein 2